MLPDQIPQDLFQENPKHSANITTNGLKPALLRNAKIGAKDLSCKPSKPGGISGHNNLLPNKVFSNTRAYMRTNQSTNMGGTTGNNRYSSQNNKQNFDLEDEEEDEQIDEAEVAQDVGDENCAQTTEPCKRSSSQRYKDRIVTMR